MNVGAALARMRRELGNAAVKHRHENRRRKEPAEWLAVIDKQRDDLKAAVAKGNTLHIRKELTQVATAALLALATLEGGEPELEVV